MIYSNINKTDAYIELTEGENKLLMPTNNTIIVDDESGMTAIKATGTRKTVALVKEENEDL